MPSFARVLPLTVAALFAGASPAVAETVTVNMHEAGSGVALAGTAAAVGGTGSGSATAGGSGQAVISGLPNGTYTVTGSLPGYKVARANGVASGTIVNLSLSRSENKFTALPVFGGANGGLYADGQPGVFYAQSTQIPQLYRTTDWGGTWAPVSVAADDAVEGLIGSGSIGRDTSATTSGYPGEIAAFVSGNIFFSRDFGLSWKKVDGTPSASGCSLMSGTRS